MIKNLNLSVKLTPIHKLSLKMKLTFILVFLSLLNIEAESIYSQNTKFTLDLKNVTVEEVFNQIKNNSEFKILHATDEIDLQRLVTISVKRQRVEMILKQLFSATPIIYKIVDKQIVLSLQKESSIPTVSKKVETVDHVIAVQNTVTGTVSDANGPLPGVNVVIQGTTTGTTTDFDGNYSIAADKGNVLVFSFIGMATKSVTVGDSNTVNVVLAENADSLDEVVVIGYGKSVKKSDLTGAVSMVGAKDIEKTPLINVDQALQGRASGVSLTQASGAPGAGYKIRVRGANSITGNNDPLVVVDGLIDVGMNSVNPSDIQSISVLKDASSTAIYGNRGANGVIIITTKKGSEGKSTLEFGSYLSFSSPTNKMDLLSPAEFIEFANTKNVGAGEGLIGAFDTQEKIDNLIANSVDYQDALYRDGAVAQNYQLSFRGGSEKISYFVSGNYLDQEGLAINTDFKRYAMRANINADISDKLSIVSSVNLQRTKGLNNHARFGERLGIGGVGFYNVVPMLDANGNYNTSTQFLGDDVASVLVNPVFLAKESKLESIGDRVQTNLSLNYKLTEKFTVNVNGGINNAKFLGVDYNPAGSGIKSPARARHGSVNRTRWQYALKLAYDNTFNEKHNLSLTAIAENRGEQQREFNATGVGFFTNLEAYNLGTADTQTIGSSFSTRQLRSVIGRAIYNYDSKYLVTASVRHDQTSVFPKNQRAVFSAFALGWNINNEAFFNSETISLLRLRAGWGQTGNEKVASDAAIDLLRNNPWIPNGGDVGIPTVLPGRRLANPDLKWETTVQTNIGFDLGIINNKFNLSFEYYIKSTEDLLLDRILPRFTGKERQMTNVGTVENKGFDISFSGTPIRTDDFSWDFNVNFSKNKNEITQLFGGQDIIFPGIRFGGSNELAPSVIKVGESIGAFYGLVYEGVDAATGNAIYADERQIIGNPNPDFTYGINNTVTYKGVDLNFFIQGVQGNDIFNATRSQLMGRAGGIPSGTSAELRNTWTATNTSASLPSLNATNTKLLTSEFVEDGSFLRLKNISLGYTLKDSNALKSIGGESLRFYISGQNLITLTDYSGIDPEISTGKGFDGTFNDAAAGVDVGAYPISKTFTLGLNFKF